jgi:D-psicose/D-tagatose/L-ribulose 3-epimerase
MKIGMNLYLWLNRLEPRHFKLLAELKAAGFDGVEIPTGDYSSAEIAAIRQSLANEGLACTVATLLSAEQNPIADDPGLQRAALDKVRADIEVAAELGAESLIGPMHSGHKVFHGRGPDAREFDRCVEFLKTVGSEAAQTGVQLAVEPLNRFECYFLNTAEQGLSLADAVDLPNVGILYDTHHANIEEKDPYEAISSLGARLAHFHVSESHRGTPGTGTVQWQESFRALRDSQYDRWLVIEAFGQEVEGIPEAVNIWRNCFASEAEVYQQGMALIQKTLLIEDSI